MDHSKTTVTSRSLAGRVLVHSALARSEMFLPDAHFKTSASPERLPTTSRAPQASAVAHPNPSRISPSPSSRFPLSSTVSLSSTSRCLISLLASRNLHAPRADPSSRTPSVVELRVSLLSTQPRPREPELPRLPAPLVSTACHSTVTLPLPPRSTLLRARLWRLPQLQLSQPLLPFH